jgi:hypothetical protein
VRFNDFLFAAHGAVMCVVCYSQFFPSIWGFEVGKSQRVSRVVLGIWWACVVAVVMVVGLVWSRGVDGGFNAEGWAWIDVVSCGGLRIMESDADNNRSIHSDTSNFLLYFSSIYRRLG